MSQGPAGSAAVINKVVTPLHPEGRESLLNQTLAGGISPVPLVAPDLLVFRPFAVYEERISLDLPERLVTLPAKTCFACSHMSVGASLVKLLLIPGGS